MPQLYSGNELAATGAGCHALAYAFNSAWLPNTIKMQKAAIKQNLFAVRFLKIQPATSKISIQFQGDKKNDTTAEAKGYIQLILVKIREKLRQAQCDTLRQAQSFKCDKLIKCNKLGSIVNVSLSLACPELPKGRRRIRRLEAES